MYSAPAASALLAGLHLLATIQHAGNYNNVRVVTERVVVGPTTPGAEPPSVGNDNLLMTYMAQIHNPCQAQPHKQQGLAQQCLHDMPSQAAGRPVKFAICKQH